LSQIFFDHLWLIVVLFDENDWKIWPKGVFHSKFAILGQPSRKDKRFTRAVCLEKIDYSMTGQMLPVDFCETPRMIIALSLGLRGDWFFGTPPRITCNSLGI